jgi:hypothetical protein
VAAAGLAAAGLATALAVAIAGGTQAADAIDSHPDGSVTVHLASLSDAAGLQAALRARGVPAIVDYSATCTPVPYPPGSSGTRPAPGRPSEVKQTPARSPGRRGMHRGIRVEVSKAGGPGGVTFTIDPSSIPAAKNVYITTYSGEMNALSIRIGSKPPTPACPPTAP